MKCADMLKSQKADFELLFHTARHEWQQEREQLVARSAPGGAARHREQGGHASTQTASVIDSQHLRLTLTDSAASDQPADDSGEEESSSPPNRHDTAADDPEVTPPHSPSDSSDGSDSDLIPATPPSSKTHTLVPDTQSAVQEPRASHDSPSEQSAPQAQHGTHTLPSRNQARVLLAPEGRAEDLEWGLDTVQPRSDDKAVDPYAPTTARWVGTNQDTRPTARHHHVERRNSGRLDHTEPHTGSSHGGVGRPPPPPPPPRVPNHTVNKRFKKKSSMEMLLHTNCYKHPLLSLSKIVNYHQQMNEFVLLVGR